MFKLFSRSNAASAHLPFHELKTDMHSHLLPGIDDGSPTMDETLELIKGLSSLGYSKLITTPHVLWDMYKNSSSIILEKLSQVQVAVKAAGIPVEIQAAAEYFLDDHVEQLLRNNEPLLPISGNLVLVEFSLAHPSMSLKSILFDMQMKGYQPVIAHPERYIYLENNKEFYEELRDIGCLFQLNLLSMSGYYGKSVTQLAQYLFKNNYYDLVGTDLHHRRHLEALRNPGLTSILDKLLASGKMKNAEL